MVVFRLILIILIANFLIYTGVVIANHGWNLLPVFFGDIAAMTWPGQFNMDFMSFLTLSCTWIVWRHQFSLLGFVLMLLSISGGVMFLALYLLILTFKTDGNMKELLMGKERATV
jgi:hypothetical protein